MPKLVSVDVKQLLGRFDHEFDFDPEWDFVIVHGPNGVGKTKLLELTHAICTNRLDRVLAIPFASAVLRYDDQTQLTVTRLEQNSPSGPTDERRENPGLRLELLRPAGLRSVEIIIDPEGRPYYERRMQMLERHLPIERLGPDEWLDMDHGDHLSTANLLERYPDVVEFPLSTSTASRDGESEAYQEFIAETSVHLIETQRLLTSRRMRPRAPTRSGPAQNKTVTQYSDDLTERLKRALAENSTVSQTLDRTFPRRVLSAPEPEVTDEQIRARYEQQGELRDRLTSTSLLAAFDTDLPLLDRDLKDWERRVLWTYLQDAEEKLATFQPLLDRVQLLQDIVNSRFLFKSLAIDRERGFRFLTEDGSELGPGSLSSGEQHELVLTYDLLFQVQEGSLVLIDEPEISLHVAWQQKFLGDLRQIAELRSLRFIIATHSPQVIHEWWHRAVALFDEDQPARHVEGKR